MVACGGRHVELSTIVQWRWLARWREVECGVRGWGGLHQRLAAVTDCSPAQPRRTATQHTAQWLEGSAQPDSPQHNTRYN